MSWAISPSLHTYLTQYDALQVHPCCCRLHYVVLFHAWVIFNCIYALHLFYPFLCWWTFWLLPCLFCYKQFCSELWGACSLSDHVFFLSICPGVGIAESYGSSIFVFLRTSPKYFLPICRSASHFVCFLCCVKLLSLSRSQLFIFVISIILGDGSKKIFLQFLLESVMPMFSLHIFILYIYLQFQWTYGFEFLSHCLKVLCNHLASYPGEGSGNPLQYSCLENPMGGAW